MSQLSTQTRSQIVCWMQTACISACDCKNNKTFLGRLAQLKKVNKQVRSIQIESWSDFQNRISNLDFFHYRDKNPSFWNFLNLSTTFGIRIWISPSTCCRSFFVGARWLSREVRTKGSLRSSGRRCHFVVDNDDEERPPAFCLSLRKAFGATVFQLQVQVLAPPDRIGRALGGDVTVELVEHRLARWLAQQQRTTALLSWAEPTKLGNFVGISNFIAVSRQSAFLLLLVNPEKSSRLCFFWPWNWRRPIHFGVELEERQYHNIHRRADAQPDLLAVGAIRSSVQKEDEQQQS